MPNKLTTLHFFLNHLLVHVEIFFCLYYFINFFFIFQIIEVTIKWNWNYFTFRWLKKKKEKFKKKKNFTINVGGVFIEIDSFFPLCLFIVSHLLENDERYFTTSQTVGVLFVGGVLIRTAHFSPFLFLHSLEKDKRFSTTPLRWEYSLKAGSYSIRAVPFFSRFEKKLIKFLYYASKGGAYWWAGSFSIGTAFYLLFSSILLWICFQKKKEFWPRPKRCAESSSYGKRLFSCFTFVVKKRKNFDHALQGGAYLWAGFFSIRAAFFFFFLSRFTFIRRERQKFDHSPNGGRSICRRCFSLWETPFFYFFSLFSLLWKKNLIYYYYNKF